MPNHDLRPSQPKPFPPRLAADAFLPTPGAWCGEAADTSSLDLAAVVTGWEHEPGTVNVREVAGLDGRPKLQMRLSLGVLQMELDGRPDGRRPHGRESLLSHHRARLAAGGDARLSPAEAAAVREEAELYQQRQVALFVLEEYDAVVRDAEHALALARLLRRHSAEARDRRSLARSRPGLLAMRGRARAALAMGRGDVAGALSAVRSARAAARRAYRDDAAWRVSGERAVLRALERGIAPVDPEASLRRSLARAVRREEYERAAALRDELARLDAA